MGRKKNRDKSNGKHRASEEGVFGMPEEVFTVKAWNHFGTAVGEELFNWAKGVMKKYPEHFPWEAKYDSIPEEVHVAYRNEAFPPIDWEAFSANSGGGIMAVIDESNKEAEARYEENKNKSLAQMFDEIFEMSEHQRLKEEQAYKVSKAIWDRHYKKYGLPYRK